MILSFILPQTNWYKIVIWYQLLLFMVIHSSTILFLSIINVVNFGFKLKVSIWYKLQNFQSDCSSKLSSPVCWYNFNNIFFLLFSSVTTHHQASMGHFVSIYFFLVIFPLNPNAIAFLIWLIFFLFLQWKQKWTWTRAANERCGSG